MADEDRLDELFHRYADLSMKYGNSFKGGMLDGLGIQDIALLAYVVKSGGSALGEAGQALGLQPSTLTGVADRLESRGLVAREPNPADRRSRLLVPTDRGRAAQEEHLARERKLFSVILGALPGPGRGAFIDAAERILDALERDAAADAEERS